MKGILFKPEMIKAIMEGRKTVTRRIIKLNFGSGLEIPRPTISDAIFRENLRRMKITSRYSVGETVYVKEAWQISCYIHNRYVVIRYKLDNSFRTFDWDSWLDKNTKYGGGGDDAELWRSPMFLPEKFARTFLLIENVRPERLQEITDEDVKREGCEICGSWPTNNYVLLWDSINPNCPFDSSPWVWRIQFSVKGKEFMETGGLKYV